MAETAKFCLAKAWLSGFGLSIPVGLAAWAGFSNGLDGVFWPLTIVCVLLSLPWSLLAGFLVGVVTFPFVAQSQFDGYLWLYLAFYGGVILGAHFNGYLLFFKKAASETNS